MATSVSGSRSGLLAEMDAVHDSGGWTTPLRTMLLQLSEAQAVWEPPTGHAIIAIVRHLTFWKELVTGRIHGEPLSPGRIDNNATFRPTGDGETWTAVRDRYLAAHAALREAVSGLTDSNLARPLPGETEPLGLLLAGLNRHDAYHAGQIRLLAGWAAASVDQTSER